MLYIVYTSLYVYRKLKRSTAPKQVKSLEEVYSQMFSKNQTDMEEASKWVPGQAGKGSDSQTFTLLDDTEI